MKFNPWNIKSDQIADRIEEGEVVHWEGVDWQILLNQEKTKIFGVKQLGNEEIAPIWHIGQSTTLLPRRTIWHARYGK